ncbi:MAG TPA: hypothetical protein VGY66_07725 [Gemmataceae bacterium]|nr:hypothetical protein [Gemmataceae bacterium]
MTDLSFTDPCILFALRRESQPFLREFHPQQRFPGAPCWARFCGPAWLTVLVLETGIGQARTEAALNWLLSKPVLGNVPYQPRVILSAGFAGALQDGVKIGDVVLATEIGDLNGKRWPVTWPGELPAGEWRPSLQRGRIVTSGKLVGNADIKEALFKKFKALAVDMESASVARLCAKHDVPFGCLRVISDEVTSALSPQLVSLLSGGRVSALKLAATLLRWPGLAPELMKLRKHTRFAAEQLGKALGELLTLTLPFGAEL